MKESKGLTPARILGDPILFLAFGFGSGLAPKAPGTFGTAAAVPLCYLTSLGGALVYGAVLTILLAAGVWLCGRAAHDLGVHDHEGIVWDEIAGYFVTMLGAPFSWQAALAGFLLFRFFDIVKPWPIRLIDRKVDGGFGIMLDDVLAGLFAAAILYLFNR